MNDGLKRTTWTIQPADDVEKLVTDEIVNLSQGRAKKTRGLRSKILNEAVRKMLGKETANSVAHT